MLCTHLHRNRRFQGACLDLPCLCAPRVIVTCFLFPPYSCSASLIWALDTMQDRFTEQHAIISLYLPLDVFRSKDDKGIFFFQMNVFWSQSGPGSWIQTLNYLEITWNGCWETVWPSIFFLPHLDFRKKQAALHISNKVSIFSHGSRGEWGKLNHFLLVLSSRKEKVIQESNKKKIYCLMFPVSIRQSGDLSNINHSATELYRMRIENQLF